MNIDDDQLLNFVFPLYRGRQNVCFSSSAVHDTRFFVVVLIDLSVRDRRVHREKRKSREK